MSYFVIHKEKALIEVNGKEICEQDCEVIITMKDVWTFYDKDFSGTPEWNLEIISKLTMWTQKLKRYKNNAETGNVRIIYTKSDRRDIGEITIHKATIWSNAKHLISSSNEDKNRPEGDRYFRVQGVGRVF